jgi:hypothetical protein
VKTTALLLFFGCAVIAVPQTRMRESATGSVHLLQADFSALESKERRADLACNVAPVPAALGFGLKFETGYNVTVTLDGIDRDLHYVVISRITDLDHPAAPPVHFKQRVLVNAPPEPVRDREVFARFNGGLYVGRGRYQVDWLLRDSAGRVCTEFWTIDARLSDKHRHVQLHIPPGQVEAIESTDAALSDPPSSPFPGEDETSPRAIPVKLLINYSPGDGEALLEMLRAISRDSRVGDTSLVLFNLEQRRILLEQSGAPLDFPAIEASLQDFTPGVVDARVLSQQDGGLDPFLANLVHTEDSRATIFIGPANPTVQAKLAGDWDVPPNVFYLRYQPDPLQPAWNDVLDRIVRQSEGRRYSIQQPRDLLAAWSDIMARMSQPLPQSR